MKYKISYCYEGTSQLLTKVMEATDEKAAIAIFHDVYGSNRDCTICKISPQSDAGATDNLIKPSEREKRKKAISDFAVLNQSLSQKREEKGSAMSKELSGSNAALASASEAAGKLMAYKARQTPIGHEHIWFYTVDGENILGPVMFASIQDKIDKRILKEASLVMKIGADWMTVSEFKTMGTSIVDTKPSPSFTQPHNARPLPVKAAASSPHSTQTAYKPSLYSSSERTVSSNKYPSLLVSFWFIYVLGTYLISLINGPLSSALAGHHSDMQEMLTAKIQIMLVISFVYLLISALIVHLSSSEYITQKESTQWHYFARGIVFLHVLLVGFYVIKAFQS